MKPPFATTATVCVAILVALVMVGAVVWVVKELRGSSGISRARCALRECLTPSRLKSVFSMIRFPVRFVAWALLGGLVLVLPTLYLLTYFRGPATFGLDASFRDPGQVMVETDSASLHVGARREVHAMLHPPGDEPPGTAVVIDGPSTVRLDHCRARAREKTIAGYDDGAQARIPISGLNAGTIDVRCTLVVKRRIRRLETVHLELSRADDSSAEQQSLYLLAPPLKSGQEKAEALAEKEVRDSPASWQRSSMHSTSGGFREQGKEWPSLDPGHPHGFSTEPTKRASSLHRLDGTRVQSSRMLTVAAIVTSRPVTQEDVAGQGGPKAIRQVYAVGQAPGERGGWCTTTRSTSQPPLTEGEHIRLRASVIEWGRSAESGGVAVMLNCPAIKVLGTAIGVSRSFTAGGAGPPAGIGH